MWGWRVDRYGPYREVLAWADLPRPSAQPGLPLIRVRAAGLSYALMLKIAGKYQVRDPLPFTPGLEVAGEVVEAPPGSRFVPGDRVMSMTNHGAFAEYTLVPESRTYPVPQGMPFPMAGGFLNGYQTAYVGLVRCGRVQPDDVLLVHGAAGGVGMAAVDIGRTLGATVIATAGSDAKLAACRRQGAHHAINYRDQNFVDAVMSLTDGRGADVILDPVGADVFDESRKCLAFEGRIVVAGFAGGRIPEIALNRLLLRNVGVIGFNLIGYWNQRPDLIDAAQAQLSAWYEAGKIAPLISRVLPMRRLPEGIAAVEARESIGKIVVVPDADAASGEDA